jgi:hypothetical protein
MLIGAISSLSSITPAYNPVLAMQPASATTSALPSTAASGTSSTAQSSAAQPAAPAQTSSASAHHAHGGGGAVGAAAAASTAGSASTIEQLIGIYSTTVGGQQYAGTVEESNGVYTVSVPNVPGATATGVNEMAAENSLGTVINELV